MLSRTRVTDPRARLRRRRKKSWTRRAAEETWEFIRCYELEKLIPFLFIVWWLIYGR